MLSGGDFLLDGYVPALDAVELDDMPAWGETSENASDDLQRGAAGGPSREVVFVDPDVPDFELLLADIRQNRDPERRIDVVVLDGEGDGVRQISRHLGEYRDLDAVHLIAHGTSGQVNLGIASLSLENLDRYAGELAGWDRSLRSGADLLIYGCDLASTVEGRALVDALGAACDCDVAASDDPTGHASLGGDWKLEYATSGVETEVALSVDAQLAWPHTLAVSVDNTSTGTAAELTSGATISHATSGNNRLMLVGVSFGKDEGHTVDSITYNGTVLTLAGARDHSDTSESRVEIWGLIAPDTGTHDVVVTFSGGPYVHRGATIGVTTFNNVDQVDAWGTFASAQGDSATPTTTVASTTNEVVFGVMALSSSNDQTLTPGAGQTGQWDLHQDDANGAGSTESGAASVVTSWSSSSSGKWVAAGVSVNEKNAIVVDTTDDYSNLDVNYGDTTSIDALLLDKGADNLISLREAIDAANQDGGGDEIRFDLTGSGPYLITPGSPLPAITDPLIIDGWSEPDHVLAPLIEIDGTGLAGDGLTFTAGSDGSTVRGLIINGFDDAAISFTDTGNATVQGNYLGTDETGTLDPTLMTNGLLLSNSDLNTIGGTTAVERNVIAGNDLSGINLLNGSNDNIIKGNYIGITAAGSAGLSNFNGIYILDSSDNTIGGTTAGAGNVISGNADEGVEIEGATSSGNSVLGNYIGVNASGTGAIANAGNGVQIENAPSNTVGGSTAAARNVISGNTGNGVHIAGSSATLNVVLGNYIGLNVSGTGAIANQGDGVRIDDSAEGASTGAPGNIIGGSVAGAGNVISGNVGKGVVIFGTASDLNEIRGNIIGLSTDGANPMGNTDDGVSVSGGADNIVIGGTTSAQRNVISSNVGHGILISGTTTTAVTVSGNYIGTDATGTSDRGNGKQGVQISDSPGNTIGGTASGAGNVISGNAWSGVSIQLDGADSNLVQGNLIGTNFTGTAAIGNDNYGVDIFNGGPDDNTIGGTTASARNIISGNAWEGVLVKGAGTTGNTVSGNYIGTNEAGDSGVPNQLGGVVIELGATGNTIGGDAGGTGNLIAYNDGIGVKVEDAATTDNPIIGNTIHDNNGLGIDLNVDGVTANDGSGSDDIDTGPNDLMNFPLVTSVEAQLVGTSVTVDFTIDSLPSTTFRVDFFKSTEADPAHGEGEAWLGSTEVGTSPAGVVISSHTMSAALVLGDYVTATATAKSGATFLGTSEFGQNGVATFVPEVDLATGTAGYTEDDPPEPIAPFATVTDPDSADFNGGNLTVTITANATASDRLGIRDEGIGAGDIGVSGSDVKYENTTIGTFTSGTGATPLVVTLNASATVAAVQELVRNITFENTSQTPTTTPDRTIEFVLTDDEPLTGPTDTLTLTVTAQNDDPTNTGGFPGTDLTVNEEDSVPVDLSAIVLADVDVGAGDLTVRLQTSAGGTIGANPGVGITIGGTSEDLTLTGSLIDVNNYLSDNSKLEFVGPVDLFGDDADSITVTVSDNGNTGSGGGGDVSLGTWNVDITNVNDVPIISATGPATIPTGSLYTLNLSVIDPDGDSITGWTVNWGDGAIETFAGNPSSVTHTFANTGFTNNILVSMTDVVGTWAAGDLISSSLQTDSVLRFSATDGSFLQEFATGDGNNPVDVQIGPDGGIYVTGFASNNVYRYDPDGTGGTEFVLAGSGGLSGASRMAFGPDGNLYVTSWNSDEVLRYDGSSGSHIDVFADSIGNSLDQPDGMTFGPDGHLYVASRGTGEILRFDGDDGSYDQVFVTHGTIGYMDIQFGPDGDLWVTNQSTDDIRRYDGTDGSYLGPFASAPTGADDFAGIAFGADDYVYMSDAIGSNDKIVRYLVTDSNTNSDFVLSGAGGLNQPVNIVFTPAHQVTITNAPPTLTILTSPVDTTSEDTEVEVSFADLTTAGNENDVDGTVDAFVVKTISSGTLKIGATAGGATAWAAVTNDTIDVGNNAYWTPDPDATGTQNAFELVAEDDEGLESSGNVTAQIDVTAVNDDPTLTATGDDPTFVAGGASVGLYSSTSIDLVEAADRVVNVILTVAGLQDGADEILVVDGTNVALTDLNSASTGSGYGVGVAVTASTATVAVSKAGDYTAAEAQTLVDGFAYLNTAGTPTGTTRTVTITLVKDDGGTANSGVESSVPNVVSTVTIEASTDPTITSDGGGAAAAISVMENATDVTTVTATDPEAPPQVLSYSIAAGGDGAKFTVGTLTGVLSFIAAPDFEAPGDGDSDNIYDFTVEVRDGGGGLDTQAVSVTVTDSPVALPAASIPEMSATATPVDSATTSPADLVTDGTFLDAGTPAGFTTYTNGQTFGGWTVTQGKADHLGSAYDSSPLGGNSVDLGGGITGSGGEPGTISQTFATVTGQQYQVTFELSGAWFIDSLDKNLRVTFDGSSQDITISRPAGWNSSTDMKWAPQMLIFTASSTTADLSFQSLDPAGEGPIVADVQVVPDPATFAYALTDDASGRFDIHATSGLITVEDGTLLDFESAATHDVTVRVTSGGNLIGEETFAIAVTDVNDAPGLVDTAVTLASVMEDAGAPSGAVGTLVSSIVDFAGGGGQNNVTDVDSGAVTGIAVTGADTANGTWHYTINGGTNWFSLGAVADGSARVLASDANTRVYFEPNADYEGTLTTALTFRAWDHTSDSNGDASVDTSGVNNGGATAFSIATDIASLTITAVNDAPTLADTVVMLAPVLEDAGAPTGAVGTLVLTLAGIVGGGGPDNVTDVDSGAVTGIAVTGADTANGTWHYTINGGANWFILGAVADGSSRVLAADAGTRVYFEPNPSFNGALATALTFRAWDRTSDANGDAGVDTSGANNGGGTAFSAATDTANLAVTATNDAPDLADTVVTVGTVAEDSGAPTGAVGSPITSIVDPVGGGGLDNVTDVDPGALTGIALTGADAINGSWHYTVDGGTTWFAVGVVSDASARLLSADPNTRLYFEPNANYEGTISSAIRFRAWDQTSGANGEAAVDTSGANSGGTTAFSAATDTAPLTVTAVNDPPSLTATGDDPSFVAGGAAVGLYSGAAVDLVEAGDRVVFLTLTVEDLQDGSDEILVVDGSSVALTDLNSVITGSSHIVDVTVAGSTATVSVTKGGGTTDSEIESIVVGLSYRNANVTPGGADRTVTITTIVDDGGGSDTATPNVASMVTIASNSAPVLADTVVTLGAIGEDAGAPSGAVGTLISDLVGFAGGGGQENVTDGDVNPLTGIAVTSATSVGGVWHFTNDGGTTWGPLGPVSDASARTLAADGDTRLYFEPDQDFTGVVDPAITFRAWDRTSAANGDAGVDTSGGNSGGGTAFSSGTDTATINVTAVNDAPMLTTTVSTLDYTERDGPVPVDPGLTIVDVDDTQMIFATVSITAGFVPGEDRLAFADQLGITGDYNEITGILTLNGIVSRTDYEAAFRAVTYENTGLEPDTTPRRVTFLGVDPGDAAGDATRTINIIPVANVAPVVTTTPSDLVYSEGDGATIIDPSVSIVDVDNATLIGATVRIANGFVAAEDELGFGGHSDITASYDATTGILVLDGVADASDYEAALRSVTYENLAADPDLSPRVVQFEVDDGEDEGTDERTIVLIAINSAPTTTGIADVSIDEDPPPTVIDLWAAFDDDEDPDDALSYSVASSINPGLFASAIVNPLTGSLTLTHASNAFGTATLTLRAADTGGLFVETDFTVTVAPINDAPTTTGLGGIVLDEDAPSVAINLEVAFNDVEDAGGAIDYSIRSNNNQDLFDVVAQGPAGGLLTLRPAVDASGTATLLIRATDTEGLFVESPLDVVVNPVNDAPQVDLPDDLSVTEGQSIVFSAVGGNAFVVSDVDAEDQPVEVTLAVNGGTLTLSGTDGLVFASGNGDAAMVFSGTVAEVNAALDGLTYVPPAQFTGPIELTVVVNDLGNTGSGGPRISATEVGVTVKQIEIPFNPIDGGGGGGAGGTGGTGTGGGGGGAGDSGGPPDLDDLEIDDGGGIDDMDDPVDDGDSGDEPQDEITEEGGDDDTAIDDVVAEQDADGEGDGEGGEDAPGVNVIPVVDVLSPDEIGSTRAGTTSDAMRRPDGASRFAFGGNGALDARPEAGPIVSSDFGSDVGGFEHSRFWDQLDRFSKQVDERAGGGEHGVKVAVGAVTGLSWSFTVGYAVWAIRGGSLLASMLSTAPMWQFFDPLPVLDQKDRKRRKRRKGEPEPEDEQERGIKQLLRR